MDINKYIIPMEMDIDQEHYSGQITLNMENEPEVSNGAKLMAYEVMEGKYDNAPYRKDKIYSAVMDYVNYLASLNEGEWIYGNGGR